MTARPAAALPAWDLGALHVTGAPPIDRAIAAALDPFAIVVPSRLLDIAADGRTILALRDGDAVVVSAGRATARTADVDVVWAALEPDGDVVYTADRDGDEDARLIRRGVALAGHGRVADPIDVHGRLAWAEGDGATTALWLLEGAEPRRVFTGDGSWAPLDISRDGTQLLARRYVSLASQALYRIDVRGGFAVAVTSVDPRVASPAGAFGARGELFAISSAGDRANLWELAARGSRLVAPELAWDVTGLAVSGDGGTVAFTTNEDGTSVLRLYDVATRTHRIAPNAPTGGVIDDLKFAADAPILALSFTDARHPRDVYTYDVATATLAQVTHAELGAIDPTKLVEPVHETIASFDGTAIAMLAYRPHAAHARVVVELHGGPEDQWRPRWSPFEQFLASRGIAVIEPNVRGSVGYGAAFAALDDGRRREDAVRDVGAVLDWIARQPELDAQAVVVMGQSYGGYLALAALIAYGDRLRGGIDLVGIADFVTFLAGTSAYRRDERRAEYGDERDPSTRAFLTAISPLARAAAIRGPLIVAQGRRDPRIPAADADRLVAAVRDGGGAVWYLAADDEGHGFAKTTNRIAFEALVVEMISQLR